MLKKMKIGDYTPQVQKRGENGAFIKGVKEGKVFWTVRDKHGYIDVKEQVEAEILSRLIKIENILKNRFKKK